MYLRQTLKYWFLNELIFYYTYINMGYILKSIFNHF